VAWHVKDQEYWNRIKRLFLGNDRKTFLGNAYATNQRMVENADLYYVLNKVK
jgi:hypothetical protein